MVCKCRLQVPGDVGDVLGECDVRHTKTGQRAPAAIDCETEGVKTPTGWAFEGRRSLQAYYVHFRARGSKQKKAKPFTQWFQEIVKSF